VSVPALPSKVGVVSFVALPSAGFTSATSGSVASTVHVLAAGLASALPAASMARTMKVWAPPAMPV
jgi:hypothetical protein